MVQYIEYNSNLYDFYYNNNSEIINDSMPDLIDDNELYISYSTFNTEDLNDNQITIQLPEFFNYQNNNYLDEFNRQNINSN